MRVAVLSDVHGNLSALEVVLDDVAQQHDLDQIICAGDLCLNGPRPAQCAERLQRASILCVYGNTDSWILRRDEPPKCAEQLCQWTRSNLTSDQLKWLAAFPFSLRIQATKLAQDDLLVVHANPVDVDTLVYPTESEQERRFKEVRQSDVDVRALFAQTTAAIVAFGHLHIPGVRMVDDLILANVSSVSMSADGDARAKYAIISYDHGWSIDWHRLPFDVDAEVRALRASRPPGWDLSIGSIRELGYVPQLV
jgi:putative phosphoesterase